MIIAIQVLLILLAAFFKAIADTVAHHQGGKLPKMFPKYADFFDMQKQGKILKGTKYPLDGWHVSNSLMIGCFILATLNSTIIFGSIAFILVFNTFYNKILKK